MNRRTISSQKTLCRFLGPWLGPVVMAAVVLASPPVHAQKVIAEAGGKRTVVFPPGVSIPQDVKDFVESESTEVLGFVPEGDLVLEGAAKGVRGRYVVATRAQGVTLRELGDTPYLNVPGNKVRNIGLMRRGRNALGVALLDLGRLVGYYVPSIVVFGRAQRALDERDRRVVLWRVNLQQDRFGTPFELQAVTKQERIGADRGAFVTPLACAAAAGALSWVSRRRFLRRRRKP